MPCVFLIFDYCFLRRLNLNNKICVENCKGLDRRNGAISNKLRSKLLDRKIGVKE